VQSAEDLHGFGVNISNFALRSSIYGQVFGIFFTVFFATGVAQGRIPSKNKRLPLIPAYQGVMTEKPVIQKLPLQLIEGDDIRFHQIQGVNSLSQTRATPTVQDRLGFLWFGTQYGLDRFDGYKFKVFRHEPGQSGSLSGVYVHKLFIDHTGALWVGCDRLLDKFDPFTETFTHFRLGGKGTSESFGPAYDIKEDRHGKLWVATLKGLFMLDPSTGQTIRFTHDPKDPSSIGNDGLNFIDEDRQGTFWVASFAGLDAFDRDTGKVTRHIAMDGWFTFHEDKFGTFWIAGNAPQCPLAVLDRNTNQLTCYSIYEGARRVTSIAAIYTMLESRDGTMWMGTEGGGLLRYDREHNRLVCYKNRPEDIESLGANSVVSLFEDREGQIWVDLHESVPYYFSERAPLFENFTHQRANLKGSLVTAVYEDRNKILWIGSTGGLNRIDRINGRNTVPPGVGVKGEILSILEDPSGTLVAGTFREGLQQLNPATGQAEPYHSPRGIPSNQSDDAIMRLLFDHGGTLWAATWGGLRRFDPASGNFTTYKPDPVDQVNYSDIKEDGKGTLWLGGEEGLQRFDPKTGKFTVYKHDPDDSRSVSDHRVNSVFFDRSGGMWLGTQDGFDKFDLTSSTAKVYYERDGLPGNIVSCILEDERGLLWMGTNNGLSSFDPRTETLRTIQSQMAFPGLTSQAGLHASGAARERCSSVALAAL
jgi:ligand-binding sensor domain-containing protein